MNDIENQLRSFFPNLQYDYFKITSEPTQEYNCIAWAFNDYSKWYWPSPYDYWPPNIPLENNEEAFIKLFESIDYQVCDNGDYEHGYEKIALYLNDKNEPTHAAKQLKNGNWSSKLGRSHDIEHEKPSSIEMPEYGKAKIFFKRLCQE